MYIPWRRPRTVYFYILLYDLLLLRCRVEIKNFLRTTAEFNMYKFTAGFAWKKRPEKKEEKNGGVKKKFLKINIIFLSLKKVLWGTIVK